MFVATGLLGWKGQRRATETEIEYGDVQIFSIVQTEALQRFLSFSHPRDLTLLLLLLLLLLSLLLILL